MSNINAKIVADSKNMGHRLTTFVVTFPRIILAEFNTHRMFSRNSASSRAIPFKKMVKSVQENPFIPIGWQKDHSGMQGTVYLSKTEKFGLNTFISSLITTLNSFEKDSKEYETLNKEIEEKIEIIESILQPYKFEEKTLDEWWLFARDKALEAACIMYTFRVTKQLCNRLLEPFMYHTVIVTSSQYENFFALRCPQYRLFSEQIPLEFRSKNDLLNYVKKIEAPEFKNDYDNLTELDWLKINKGMAEIHIMALAEAMWDEYRASVPKQLQAGEWHIPFGDNINLPPTIPIDEGLTLEEGVAMRKVKIAVARCARVSYTVVGEEGKPDNYDNDIKLHDRLAESGHFSPFEHIGRAMSGDEIATNALWCAEHIEYGWSGNFRGFIQYRKMLPNENKV